MDIGIIGAGYIGGTLTRRLAALGHQVRVANSRSPETLAELAAETGATAVWANEAARDAELVILSIPQKSVLELADGILATAKPGAPLLETNNYYPQRDGFIEAIEAGTPESVWVAEQLGVPVYKAFNNIWWKHLLEKGKPAGAADRIALPIAGSDEPARAQVFALIDALGFDPVYAGPLEESWRQHPGTPVYGKDYDIAGVRRALAEASPERPAEFRAERAG